MTRTPSDDLLLARAVAATGGQMMSFTRWRERGGLPGTRAAIADRTRAARWLWSNGLPGGRLSYPDIARIVGYASHTSAMAACRSRREKGGGRDVT